MTETTQTIGFTMARWLQCAAEWVINWLVWGAFASIMLAWTIYLKPMIDLPLITFRAHPDVVIYLLGGALASLGGALVLTLALRGLIRRFQPSLDARPTLEAAMERAGATKFGERMVVRLAYFLSGLFVKRAPAR